MKLVKEKMYGIGFGFLYLQAQQIFAVHIGRRLFGIGFKK